MGLQPHAMPLGLYVHYPWCIKKCPYCDFNSHSGERQDQRYADALLSQLNGALQPVADRPISSIFFGGGTPSLMPASLCSAVIEKARQNAPDAACEISLEANPGAVDQAQFAAFAKAGVNRISLGVQSFDDQKLQALGRIHQAQDARLAIAAVQALGLRLNIDLMYGLPQQSEDQALDDLQQAIDSGAEHISWYQLTYEENTPFYHQPPPRVSDDALADISDRGRELLAGAGYNRYEVSAYARNAEARCAHNLNYWRFGDYVGIGAGAHGKLSFAKGIWRSRCRAQPAAYMRQSLDGETYWQWDPIDREALAFEFMLNALRLSEGVDAASFESRTGLALCDIDSALNRARALGLITEDSTRICSSEKGLDFLFETLALF